MTYLRHAWSDSVLIHDKTFACITKKTCSSFIKSLSSKSNEALNTNTDWLKVHIIFVTKIKKNIGQSSKVLMFFSLLVLQLVFSSVLLIFKNKSRSLSIFHTMCKNTLFRIRPNFKTLVCYSGKRWRHIFDVACSLQVQLYLNTLYSE